MALTKNDIQAIAKEMVRLQNTPKATTQKTPAKKVALDDNAIKQQRREDMALAFENQINDYLTFRNNMGEGHNYEVVSTKLKPLPLPNGNETLTLEIREDNGKEIVTETICAKVNMNKGKNGNYFPNSQKPYVLTNKISYKDENGYFITRPLSVIRTPKA